jgi:hypothetical protein
MWSLNKIMWAGWWIGVVLVIGSWFHIVPRPLGFVGFLLTLVAFVYSVARNRAWRPPD